MSSRQPLYAAVAGVCVLTGLYLAGKSYNTVPGKTPFRTPGVRNIEDRYSAAGGSKDHLPGIASPRGNSEKVDGGNEGVNGAGSAAWKRGIAEQNPTSAVSSRSAPPGETHKLQPKRGG